MNIPERNRICIHTTNIAMSQSQQRYASSQGQPAGYENQNNAPPGSQNAQRFSSQSQDHQSQNPDTPLQDPIHQSTARFPHRYSSYDSPASSLYSPRTDDYGTPIYPSISLSDSTKTASSQRYQKQSHRYSDPTSLRHTRNYHRYHNRYSSAGYAYSITRSEKDHATIDIQQISTSADGSDAGYSHLEIASMRAHGISLRHTANTTWPGRQGELAKPKIINDKSSQVPALVILLVILAMMATIATGQAFGNQYFDYWYAGIGCAAMLGCLGWFFFWVGVGFRSVWFDDVNNLESREEMRAKEIQRKKVEREMLKAQAEMQVVEL
ncbi:hypothetical protein BZA77DRAFT_354351 [Pyronema omphalodes]|nr:hypothetical protein BZA77DRAFT_354351 [Pyronema omphalodes]